MSLGLAGSSSSFFRRFKIWTITVLVEVGIYFSPMPLVHRADIQDLSPVVKEILQDFVLLAGELHHLAVFDGAPPVLIQLQAGVQDRLPLSLCTLGTGE